MTNLGINISTEAYQQFLAEIVNLVQSHRIVAVQAVQTVSNQLYWNIGEGINWSPQNLWFMRQLGREYSNVKQPASDLENIKKIASRVPWQSAEQFQQIFIAGSEELP